MLQGMGGQGACNGRHLPPSALHRPPISVGIGANAPSRTTLRHLAATINWSATHVQGLVCSRTATHTMACALWLAPSTCTWVALPPSVHRRYDHPDRGIIFLLGAGTFAPVPCRLNYGGNIFQFSSVQHHPTLPTQRQSASQTKQT